MPHLESPLLPLTGTATMVLLLKRWEEADWAGDMLAVPAQTITYTKCNYEREKEVKWNIDIDERSISEYWNKCIYTNKWEGGGIKGLQDREGKTHKHFQRRIKTFTFNGFMKAISFGPLCPGNFSTTVLPGGCWDQARQWEELTIKLCRHSRFRCKFLLFAAEMD